MLKCTLVSLRPSELSAQTMELPERGDPVGHLLLSDLHSEFCQQLCRQFPQQFQTFVATSAAERFKCLDFVNFVSVFKVRLIPEKILIISQHLPHQGKIYLSFILTAFKIYLFVSTICLCLSVLPCRHVISLD